MAKLRWIHAGNIVWSKHWTVSEELISQCWWKLFFHTYEGHIFNSNVSECTSVQKLVRAHMVLKSQSKRSLAAKETLWPEKPSHPLYAALLFILKQFLGLKSFSPLLCHEWEEQDHDSLCGLSELSPQHQDGEVICTIVICTIQPLVRENFPARKQPKSCSWADF